MSEENMVSCLKKILVFGFYNPDKARLLQGMNSLASYKAWWFQV